MRYARQQTIEGWDQGRLEKAVLAIAGSGPTAFMSGLMAAAMGFGRLVLFTGEPASRSKTSALAPADSWGELFDKVNPQTKVYCFPKWPSEKTVARLPLDGLIVAANDRSTQDWGRRLAQCTGAPTVAGCAAGFAGIWGKPIKNKVAAQFDGRAEAPLAGQIVAALLVDEMRKTLMPLPGEVGPTTRSHILALACPDGAEAVQTPLRASQLHLALVGAGALGTWFGLALGASGIEGAVDIFDDDDIDESNLNRQVLFYEAVGQPKALVLAARLQQFFGRAQWTGYGMAVQEGNSAQLANADVLVACPDNFAARALLNGVARRRRRALINGGTSAMGGSCMTYAPGRTACLSCRMRIEQLAENERQSQSCAQVQAAVVTSNAIIGALMAWKVRKMFDGRVERSIWEYDGRAATARIGAHSPRPACRCHLE